MTASQSLNLVSPCLITLILAPLRMPSKFRSRNYFLLHKLLVFTSNLSWFLLLHFNPLIFTCEPLLGYCGLCCFPRSYLRQWEAYYGNRGEQSEICSLVASQWEVLCYLSLDVDFHRSYSCSCIAVGHGAVPALDIPDPSLPWFLVKVIPMPIFGSLLLTSLHSTCVLKWGMWKVFYKQVTFSARVYPITISPFHINPILTLEMEPCIVSEFNFGN